MANAFNDSPVMSDLGMGAFVKFGIDLPNYGKFGDPALLLDLAMEAEAAAWDGFFLWDHLVSGGRSAVTDPWVVLSAAAVKTEHIRLGTMVTPLARRRMARLARETVAIDHLSGGRLILGVGLGHFDKKEFAYFGDEGDRRTRARILDESLDLLSLFWSGEKVSFPGEFVQAQTTPFLPTPLQEPRIPVWVAGSWPNRRPMRRAARWDGAFPIDARGGLSQQMSVEDMSDVVSFLADCRPASGSFDIVQAGLMTGDDARDIELTERYADVGVTWWLENFFPSRMSPAAVRRFIRRGPPTT